MLFTPSYNGLAEVTDKRSPYYRKCGRVIDHSMLDTLTMLYELEFPDKGRFVHVWFNEKHLRKAIPKEMTELWKFFCYKGKALVAYTLIGEFEGEEEATLKSIALERNIPIDKIDIYIGTVNEIDFVERRFR